MTMFKISNFISLTICFVILEYLSVFKKMNFLEKIISRQNVGCCPVAGGFNGATVVGRDHRSLFSPYLCGDDNFSCRKN